MRRLSAAVALGLAALTALPPNAAHAFSTRVHIMIANKVRDALVDAGDGSVPLRLGEHSVLLPQADVDALRDFPLAFRAGAVGPDNMVFPGMTDPSHALGQRPFEQCELLYQEAATPEERAYALGCFLHGSTDAVAHHYVNYMTGETFTLTPITSDRQQSLSNVVRHILAESAIQDAAVAQDPDAFAGSKLLHTIPIGFVLRAYLDTDSPLWQMMAAHPKAAYDAAVQADPDASLGEIVASLDIAPADHLVLSPVYLGEVDGLIDAARADLVAKVAAMQDPNTPDGAELQVTPGDDGELGTYDDETDCAFTCPQLYATYFTYVGLLAPRYNAQNQPLPSAFDKIGEELRGELMGFHPAYMQTVANLSAKLNEAPNGMNGGFGVTKEEVKELFSPMTQWADTLGTIDYDTLLYAILPDWYIDLQTAMQAVGIDIDLAPIVKAIFDPIVQPIKDAIQQAFIAQAQVFLEQLAAEIEALKEPVYAEYDARLAAAAHPDLGGDALDHFYDSGLFAHSFNVAAAALAEHAAVLPVGDDPYGVGPASFDASYTPAWMQAGRCEHLAPAVFPLGIDVKGALSVRDAGGDYPAQLAEDSPVECHDGALSMFTAAPSVAACAIVKLDALLGAKLGSVSRAYPPAFAADPGGCDDLVIPGLPEPPPASETDTDDTSNETTPNGDTESDTDPPPTTGETTPPSTGPTADTQGDPTEDSAGADDDGGCGCTSTRPPSPLLLALGLLALARRRRRAALAAALGVAACGDSGSDDGPASQATATTDDPATTAPADTTTAAPTTDDPDPTTGDATTDAPDPTTDDATSTGPDPTGSQVGELLDALDGTVWSGAQTREGRTRAYELRFDTGSLLWSELRNPYGPSRLREMRAMTVDDDLAVHTTVIQPPGWELHPENGRKDDWQLEVIDGDPRTLRTTRAGVVEEFTEGPWPAPEGGLLATVRVFEVGGAVDKAFCDSGANGFEYKTLFDFAHGLSDEIVATDVVAGARLDRWTDPTNNNQFSVSDVDGFDRDGGTDLSDTFNFFVTYTGTVQHPGGGLSMREGNDSVEDAVWVFLNDKVGSDNEGDLFLEVQGFAWPDETSDEPSGDFPAGDLPFEAILVRCTEAISDVDVQIRLPNADWTLVGDVATDYALDPKLFPPAL